MHPGLCFQSKKFSLSGKARRLIRGSRFSLRRAAENRLFGKERTLAAPLGGTGRSWPRPSEPARDRRTKDGLPGRCLLRRLADHDRGAVNPAGIADTAERQRNPLGNAFLSVCRQCSTNSGKRLVIYFTYRHSRIRATSAGLWRTRRRRILTRACRQARSFKPLPPRLFHACRAALPFRVSLIKMPSAKSEIFSGATRKTKIGRSCIEIPRGQFSLCIAAARKKQLCARGFNEG